MNKNTNSYCFLTITLTIVFTCTSPSHSMTLVHSIDEFAQGGSGAQTDLDECISTFVGYDNTFLRGVSEEYFLSYKNTSYDECIRYCCMETHFFCSSFSYFRAIRLCYVMNSTKYEDEAHLATVPGWTHYHKVYPVDETTMIPENFTTVFTSNASISNATDFDSTSNTKSSSVNIIEDPLNSSPLEIDVAISTDDVKNSNRKAIAGSGQIESNDVKSSNSSSTDSVKSLPDETKEKMNEDETGYTADGKAERLRDDSSTKGNCGGAKGKECQNGGVCSYVSTSGDEVAVSGSSMTKCKCPDGYTGNFCEIEEADAQEEAGIPAYVIALIVIGLFIFLLFITLFLVCCVNKQKSGEYKVKWRRDRWRKKTKKNEARRSESFLSDAPIPSRPSEPNVDETADSPSSLTSV